MKSAAILNDKPPFLKGLNLPEVALLSSVMTVTGLVLGMALALWQSSLIWLIAGIAGGATTILWLPKAIADYLIRLREGKPRGWLYQQLAFRFYTSKYLRKPGRYHHKKEKHHV